MNYDNPTDIWDGIAECPNHQHMMEGCEWCATEMQERSDRLGEMSKDAEKRLHGLAQQGAPQMPPSVMIEARMEVLIDTILRDPKDRLRYEGEVGRRVMLAIKNMQQAVKQPVLHVAKSMPQNVHDLRRN